MFDNIKLFIFALCFHGIRFKVNKDWVSGIDTLLFYNTFLPKTHPSLISFVEEKAVQNLFFS